MLLKICRWCSVLLAAFAVLLLITSFSPVQAQNREIGQSTQTSKPASNAQSTKPEPTIGKKPPSELIVAMDIGDVDQFDKLLNTGINPNSVVSPSGKTLLMAARSAPLVKLLLNHGADPTLRDNRGATALHHALLYPDALSIIPILIEKGAQIDAEAAGWSGETPFLYAGRLFFQNEDSVLGAKVLHMLANMGADINAADDQGYTLLTHAVVNDKPDLVGFLLDLGANPMVPTKEGKTALDWAEELGFIDIVELLEAARPTY